MKRLVAGISILVLLALGIGLAVYFFYGKNEEGPQAKPAREPSAELIKQRGPRPTDTRLPDGVKQVDDPAQALAMARDSLDRVEEEIADAKDDIERVKLERKKKLIEQAIVKLTETP